MKQAGENMWVGHANFSPAAVNYPRRIYGRNQLRSAENSPRLLYFIPARQFSYHSSCYRQSYNFIVWSSVVALTSGWSDRDG